MAFLAIRPVLISFPQFHLGFEAERRNALVVACSGSKEAKSRAAISRVVIVGGGAAGHLAALTCARRTRQRAQVLVLESSSDVLSKVRLSGGGRCNVTSALDMNDRHAFAANYPHGRHEMPSVVSRFGSQNVMSFFENEGVALKTEVGGKVFPVSNDSSSITNALVHACRDAGVQVLTKSRVVRVTPLQNHDQQLKYQVHTSNGQCHDAHFVVVSTGSARSTWTWAATLGHRVIDPVPSLFTFGIDDIRLRGLAGISVADVSIHLQVNKRTKRYVPGLSQRGPMLVTHWGLSGPAVLSLSAFGARVLHDNHYQMQCVVDWVPHYSFQEKLEILRNARRMYTQKYVSSACPFRKRIPKRLWQSLVHHTSRVQGFEVSTDITWSSASNKFIDGLANQLHLCSFKMSRKGQFKDEFVTSGGVSLCDINTATFESKRAASLYFAGETLDVDGRTGGFNLQFAWSSGYIAGNAIADIILDSK